MTLEKVHEPIAMHPDLGSGNNRKVTRVVLGEVRRDDRQQTVDKLNRANELEAQSEIKNGTKFES